MANEILGQHEPTSTQAEFLTLSFSPLSVPLRSRWRNNGVSADFMGDYATTFLPVGDDAPNTGDRQSEIRHAVSYIANEFLENAMKYHARRADVPIGIRLELCRDRIVVSSSNAVAREQAKRYRGFVETILGGNAEELLLRRLECGSDGGEPSQSALGLLTMISDYGVRLGWKFEAYDQNSEWVAVTTSAILPLAATGGV